MSTFQGEFCSPFLCLELVRSMSNVFPFFVSLFRLPNGSTQAPLSTQGEYMVCHDLQVGSSDIVVGIVTKSSSLLDFLESVLPPTR